VIVENVETLPEFPVDVLGPGCEAPPAPTAIGKEATVAVMAVPCKGLGPNPEALYPPAPPPPAPEDVGPL
jgi:hypothetical protein